MGGGGKFQSNAGNQLKAVILGNGPETKIFHVGLAQCSFSKMVAFNWLPDFGSNAP